MFPVWKFYRWNAATVTAAALAAALTVSASGGPTLADEAPYPVWWSPMLELNSLDAIDARLARHIWPSDDVGLPLAKWDGDVRQEASAVNCIELERLVADGFYGIGSNGFALQLYNQALCRAIETMRRARLPERSYLRDFILDEHAIHVLPAMVDLSPSCDYRCRQRVANERRIPLSRFEPVFRVTVTSAEEIEIRTIGSETDVTILARGDFNGDGLDDLLLFANGGATEGTWGGAEVYLLTRETPGSVLRVLEEGVAGCTDYQCQDSYDYPRVLRDSDPDIPRGAEQTNLPHPITFRAIGEDQGNSDFIEANQGPPYPVWWWPLMGLESLADIDELLARDYWLSTDGTILEIESVGEMVEVPAKSCRTLLKMLERGYRLTADHRSHVSAIASCRALEWLKTARPAEVSHLRGFVLDESVMERLPALLGFWTSSCLNYEALAYNEAGESWHRFTEERAANRQVPTFADGSVYHLQLIDERSLRAWALAWVIDIEVLAAIIHDSDRI